MSHFYICQLDGDRIFDLYIYIHGKKKIHPLGVSLNESPHLHKSELCFMYGESDLKLEDLKIEEKKDL